MGRYVPPDLEGTTTGNKLHSKRAPGTVKSDGTQTVRFELPFAIWCTTCTPHETIIGQGVRFNAVKKKVGMYYSTPIWSFEFTHTACGGSIEIRTDPQKTEYVVTKGARKRDYGEKEDEKEGEIPVLGYRRDALGLGSGSAIPKDPFERMEKEKATKAQASADAMRVEELKRASQRDWEDPYAKSRKLRALFREGRHERERKERKDEELRDRFAFDSELEISAETEEDRVRAGLVDFHPPTQESSSSMLASHRTRGLFEAHAPATPNPQSKISKSGSKKATKIKKEDLARTLGTQLRGNTRAVIDPFLTALEGDGSDDGSPWRKSTDGKRKRGPVRPLGVSGAATPASEKGGGGAELDVSAQKEETLVKDEKDVKAQAAVPLVDYGSESESE